MKKIASIAMLSLGLLMLGGCSGNRNPPTSPVTGVVTLDGKPVSGASVVFNPATPGEGHRAAGMTDPEGKFTLGTFVGGDGAVKGSYNVVVTKWDSPGGESPYAYGGQAQTPAPAATETTTKEQSLDDMYSAYNNAYKGTPKDAGKGKRGAAKNDLPAKYEQPETSGLKVEVKEGPNKIDLQLTKK